MIIVDRINNHDIMEIQVEIHKESFTDHIRGLQDLARRIQEQMDSVLGINAKITFVEPGTVQRFEGKSKHVIDKRVY